MGQEILYCSKCQTQLRSADFENEKAYRLHNSVYCYKCARENVHSLPKETIHQLLGQIARQEVAAEKKNSSTSRILHVVEIRPGKSLPLRKAAGAGSGTPGSAVWITLGGLAAVGVLVALIVSGSSEPKSAPRVPPPPVAVQTLPPDPRPGPDAPVPRPPAPPAPPALPAPAGTFDAEATESLRRAREFTRANPTDLVGQIALFEKAAWDSSGTPLQDAAQKDLESLRTKDRSLALRELPGLLESVRTVASKEEFGKAVILLERGRKKHAVIEWTGPVEKALTDLRDQADSLYGPLKEKALAAARSRNSGELQAIRERVSRWSLEEFRSDLDREINRATPPANPAPLAVEPKPAPPVTPKPAPVARPLPGPAPGDGDSDPGLVGHWKFDEGKGALALDSSRNRNSAALLNGPLWTDGKLGGGLKFNGGEAHLLVPSTPAFADLGPLTASAWIKPGTLKLGRIVAKESGGRGRWMVIAGETGVAFAKDFSVQELRRDTVPNAISSDVWQHLAVTWDGTTQVAQVHIYVNGIEAAYAKNQDGAGMKMSDAAMPLLIGNRGDLARGFQGTVDDVRIYARVLTAKEIALLASPKAK
ncbi:MAG TPA: LamG domain-containing protein [Planctomycetota bacterium]|nr:LamG domain-containing protein [Planctomycetota bacterium]